MRNVFIAVIDDDEDSRFAMEARCLQWGSHVVSAASSSELIERLSAHLRIPDLILCDYRLRNGETGATAINHIRSKFDAAIPAIIITGDLTGAECGAEEIAKTVVLRKPASAEAIRKTAVLLDCSDFTESGQ
jgi:CheY-like chemotaxis protein